MQTHTGKTTEMGWHMAGTLAGAPNTYAGTCHRGSGVEMKSMQRLLSLPPHTSVNILLFPIFNEKLHTQQPGLVQPFTPDTLNCKGNILHSASFKTILCPGLFLSKTK